MKDLLPLVRSHIKNSTTLISQLKQLPLPTGAKIFTADAVSMYTNIDTTLGMDAIRQFLITNENDLTANFPVQLFLSILETVMRNNIFSFGETYWIQEAGTAMGTPAACAYATITFGHYENTIILPEFQENLLYYRRYIDDVFGIWIPPRYNPTRTWENFKAQVNNWGSLNWKTEDPTDHTTFLDLNITIENSSLTFSTFQKPLNLYLYLPPLSAHPLNCLKGLIKGEMQRFWQQNTTTGFQELIVKFIERLHARGHSIQNLACIFNQAAASLQQNNNRKNTEQEGNTLFIHWLHHPNGLKNRDIKKIYGQTLQPHLNYQRTIIAVSRPKNLKDILTKTQLQLPEGQTIQQHIDSMIN